MDVAVTVPLSVLWWVLALEGGLLLVVLGALVVVVQRARRGVRRGALSRLNQDRLAALATRSAASIDGAGLELLRRAGRSRRATRRAMATRLLSAQGGPAALDAAADRLTDRSPRVRRAALAALTELLRDDADLADSPPGRAATAHVVDLLDRPDLLPRAALAAALTPWGGRASRALSEAMPASRAGRRMAAQVFGQLRDPASVPTLWEQLGHPYADVRSQACASLAACDAIEAEDGVRLLLADDAWWVRMQAARTLGELGSRSAVAELRAAVDDPIDLVREAAALSLRRLGAPGERALRDVVAGAGPLSGRRSAGVALQGLPVDPELARDLARAGVVARFAALEPGPVARAQIRNGLHDLALLEPADPKDQRLRAEALARAEELLPGITADLRC